MIRVECLQGSGAWFQARLGIPTASQFERILTPKTLKLSGSAPAYRNELLAEWLLGESQDTTEYDFTARGSQMEAEARAYYELLHDVEVEQVGFLLRDDRRAGGSPDGLVGSAGMLELKCPSAAVHVGYLLDTAGDKYKAQMQGNLWVAEREWCDFVSYHPTLPKVVVRVTRDEAFIAALAEAMQQFCDGLDAAKASLMARGFEPQAVDSPLAFADRVFA